MGFDDGYRRIGSDPFLAAEQDSARRLRGRLTVPVTVWTAYDRDGIPAGITVSSVLVVEGEPPEVIGLLGPLSEFWDAVSHSKGPYRNYPVVVVHPAARMPEEKEKLMA